tara:strand:+ start:308 stop:1144 length:837 start_codon:yes stop_codon:yes gene_type:complete
MANIDITGGITYQFARIQGNTIILDSDDHSHAIKTFANKIHVTGSNVPNEAMLIEAPEAGFVKISRAAGTNAASLLKLKESTTDGHCAMLFDGVNDWIMGAYNDSARDFQISDTPSLRTAPRTNGLTGLVISTAREIFLPNIDAAAGTYPVEYNTTTREITYDSSTLRTKKNIVNAPSILFDKILELQPREFERKNSKSDNITNTGKFIGLIAEEAASIHNQFAKYTPNFDYDENGKRAETLIDNQSVPGNIDWPAVTTALIGKIQDLEQRITTLENN